MHHLLHALSTMQSLNLKTLPQETKAQVAGLWTRKHPDRFDEADKSKS